VALGQFFQSWIFQIMVLILIYILIVWLRRKFRRFWSRRVGAFDVFVPFLLFVSLEAVKPFHFLYLWLLFGWLLLCVIFLLVVGLKNRVLLYRLYFRGLWRLTGLYLLIVYIVGVGFRVI